MSLIDAQGGWHNRWHPSIPAAFAVTLGKEVAVALRDSADGQVTQETLDRDVLGLDMRRGHALTGPLWVEGAEPGDLLDVEVLAVESATFGFTLVIPGFGMLGDLALEPLVVKWEIADGVARSEQLPGVAVAGRPFLGVIGVAPSHDSMRRFAEREAAVARRGAFVLGPDPVSAVPVDSAIASEGLRTMPPRETGGNMDIKEVRVGSVITLPVQVPGALLSVGDSHFAQGDGECCGFAIEIAAHARLRISLRKAEELSWYPRFPTVRYRELPDTEVQSEWFATTGIPVTGVGENANLDLNLAARLALEQMSAMLIAERGLTFNQAYALMSVAVDLRISECVNSPNALVSAALPLGVFE
jgi:formamidase